MKDTLLKVYGNNLLIQVHYPFLVGQRIRKPSKRINDLCSIRYNYCRVPIHVCKYV